MVISCDSEIAQSIGGGGGLNEWLVQRESVNHVKPESMTLTMKMIVVSEARTLSGCMLGSISQPAGRQGVYMY